VGGVAGSGHTGGQGGAAPAAACSGEVESGDSGGAAR
jgi:hypothetical protein